MIILRSIGAVLAGLAFIILASIGTDLMLEHMIMPSMDTPRAGPAVLALALAYRTIYGVTGGWIAARLAPVNPVRHAVVLGAIGTFAAVAGAIAMWGFGNHWYPIALAMLSLPGTWLGGRLAERRTV